MTWGASPINDKPICWSVLRAVGDIVVPLPAQVLLGVTYGPTGADYTGTATSGTSAPSAADIAAAVMAQLQATAIPVNLTQVKGQDIVGGGTEANPWGPG